MRTNSLFQRVLTDALAEFEIHGFDSVARLQFWIGKMRAAANATLSSPAESELRLRQGLGAIYRKFTERGIYKLQPDVARYTLSDIQPRYHAMLEQRIRASADLIKINRQQAIEKTLQRFSGWASSIPAGGSRAVEKREAKANIAKPLRSMSFEERRLVIDQGHKLVSNINAVVAQQNNAIAMVWHSRWRQKNYNYRPDHKERDEHVYAIRGNWAIESGLMKAGPDGYLDEITQPAEEVFCRCSGTYIHNIRNLPDNMLTSKGRERVHTAK